MPESVFTAAQYDRFTSRGAADFQDKLLFVLSFQFGAHVEKSAAP